MKARQYSFNLSFSIDANNEEEAAEKLAEYLRRIQYGQISLAPRVVPDCFDVTLPIGPEPAKEEPIKRTSLNPFNWFGK